MKQRFIAGLVVLLVTACGPTSNAGPRPPGGPGGRPAPSRAMLDDAAEDFAEVRDGFLEWYLEAYPVRATELGVHTHDTRLPDLSRAGIQDRIDVLLQWIADVEGVRFDFMRDEDRFDYAVLEYAIRAELLNLEEVRDWANDPRVYTAIIARGLASVVEREYAPLDQRMTSAAARLNGASALLDAARTNLRNPPRLWTEIAIADARGLIQYIEDGPPARLESQADGGSPVDGYAAARRALMERLTDHVDWLESNLLPRSSGNFRLGRYLLERKLRYSEHVVVGVEELERINADAMATYRGRIDSVAAVIDPDRTAREVMDSINAIRPTPDQLLATAEEMMVRARDWLVESGVVELPEGATMPVVRDAPPYARDDFTSLDAPGPFEEAGLTAYFNITNVQPDWDDELVRQHLAHFSRSALMATTLHETFPGHYVQALYRRELPTIRRVFTAVSFSGGWAHYAAEMALDEGLSDDPAVRLGQLWRALQHHARWYAALRIHAGDASLDKLVADVMRLAYMPEFPARREVIRATREPAYLGDALGRLQLVELRQDYEAYLAERGETFSLPEFHHRILRLGLPFTLAREALMPRDRDNER